VALGGRRTDRLAAVAKRVEEAGGKSFPFACELSDADSLHGFFDAAEAELGPLDVVVANAAEARPVLLHEADPADVARELSTNLLHPILLARR
jgi:3-oxoacyl-[acyl-carrier protein] reductase